MSLARINRCRNHPIGNWHAVALLLALGMVGLEGCGKGLSVPSTVPVRGMVKYKGKPLQGIRVTLHSPTGTDPPAFIPSGLTGPDGRFTFSTGAPGNGAPPGTYVVTFEKPEIGSPASTGYVETEVDAFRGQYSDPAKSKWTVTIEQGETSLPPFDLQ